MDLFLVTRTDGIDWDEYDSMIVCAKDEAQARRVLPTSDSVAEANHAPADPKYTWGRTWIAEDAIDTLQVTRVGTAARGMPSGCVLASFNAG